MKNIVTVLCFLLLATSPAFADQNAGYAGKHPCACREAVRQADSGSPEGEFVFVRGGCFEAKEAARSCVSDFYMGRMEITRSQWEKVMGSLPSGSSSCTNAWCPVVNVSWTDAQKFIAILNSNTGGSFRLPTEAEWEYAARSGGIDETKIGMQAEALVTTHKGKSDIRTDRLLPVGQSSPNMLGIYDMLGSVWEWTEDRYKQTRTEKQKITVKGPGDGTCKTLRGGSWMDTPDVRHPSFKIGYEPDVQREWIGFRLVRTAPATASDSGKETAPTDHAACSCMQNL